MGDTLCPHQPDLKRSTRTHSTEVMVTVWNVRVNVVLAVPSKTAASPKRFELTSTRLLLYLRDSVLVLLVALLTTIVLVAAMISAVTAFDAHRSTTGWLKSMEQLPQLELVDAEAEAEAKMVEGVVEGNVGAAVIQASELLLYKPLDPS